MQPDDAYSPFRFELVVQILPLALAALVCVLGAAWSGRYLIRSVRVRWRGLLASRSGTAAMEFAVAFPFFLLMVLVSVQISLLINANLIVDYAAFCAARSAAVWLPADLPDEQPNVVSDDKDHPGKWERIRRAASIACLPISPRLTSAIGDFLGLRFAAPTFGDPVALEQLIRRVGGGQGVDPLRFTVHMLDKLAASYFLTEVELETAEGQPRRQFESAQSVTVRVTHRFYMNVPFAGPAMGMVLGKRFVSFIGPYYVPVSSSYSLMVAPG